MDDSVLRDYFLRPSCPSQRRYETLRAVFVEGLSQRDAAQRFGYSYGALRQLVLQFRSACAVGAPPPFSTSPPAAARPTRRLQGPRAPTSQPPPTSAV
jgi:transposase